MNNNTLVLEQIFAGELPKSDYKDENLEQKIEQIELSNKEILKEYPASEMQKMVEAKMQSLNKTENTEFVDFGGNVKVTKATKFNKMFTLQRGLVAAAVLAIMLFVPLMINQKNEATGIDSSFSTGVSLNETVNPDRAKGTSALFIYKQTANGKQELLRNNAKVFAGDTIQLTYVSGNAKYGMIISIDGNGCVTQHFPAKGVFASELNGNGEVKLDYAYRLDDAPNFERFLFITSDKKFSASGIENAVARFKNIDQAKTENFTKHLTFDVDIIDFMLTK